MSGTAATRLLRLQRPLLSGPDVLRVQQRLAELGFAGAGLADSYYGEQTVRAVQQFQRASGLAADGAVGPGTLARLMPRTVPPAAAPVPATGTPLLRFQLPLMRGAAVLTLQEQLKVHGAFKGDAIEGAFDTATQAAVRAFQASAGLGSDGVVGPATWARLNARPEPASAVPDAAVPAAAAVAAALATPPRPPVSAAPSAGPRLSIPATHMTTLTGWHSQFAGGSEWRLHRNGVAIGRAEPRGSGGDPATARRIWQNFRTELEAAAEEFHVPVELLIATIATESSGKPDATRLEPGYTSDTATPHRVSIGLTQTLISTARATLKDPGVDRAFLLKPLGAIRAGASYIAQQRRVTLYDPPVVACAYNAGSVRENASARNRWRMVQYPIGTSAHADRFVEFFNDALAVFDAGRPTAPNFHEVLATLAAPAGAAAQAAAPVRTPAGADAVVAACKRFWPGAKGDCNLFARSVAKACGVPLEGNANSITDLLAAGTNGWRRLENGVAAAAGAAAGRLVVGGLRGDRQAAPSPHGHVVVVVPGPLNRGVYPTAYWGSLAGQPYQDTTVNYAWAPGDRDHVVYAEHEVA